jgi:ribulose-5-phosphate 4-epimerase/fuculose-1-phosphate aldolase
MDEGYIKYCCNWTKNNCIHPHQITELNKWRQQLYENGLIGMYADGIGYGNISERGNEKSFIISGSATGGLQIIDASHYARVTSFNLQENTLSCEGLTIASSESLTHAALYAIDPSVQSVVHVHHHEGWLKGLHRLPTTPAEIAYGTPEMAAAVQSCYSQYKHTSKLIFMAGHEDGIISVGQSPEEAVKTIISFIER